MAVAQKEYMMLLTIAGAIGPNFNATFQKAEKELKQLKQAQAELSKQQANIDSYKTQAKAIQETQDKLSGLRSKLARLEEAYKNNQQASSRYAAEIAQTQKEETKTEAALHKKYAVLTKLDEELTRSGVNVHDLTSEEKRLNDEIIKNAEAIKKDEEALKKNADAQKALGEIIERVAIADKLKQISEAYLDCVKASAQFEASMSAVKALSGATGMEMEQLKEKAIGLAETTKFTADEVAKGMSYMGMAGWDVNEMMSGMSGVIALAAASGEDLERVSDIVTDNLTAFGMTAFQTSEMADILAAAATSSNTNIEIMGETFKNSASVAGALGYELSDVATAIGIMANNGVKGSIAGTALRNIFNGLLKGVTLTSEAFGEYEFTAIKSDGTLKSFGETIDELRGKFELMSEAEKVMNAKDLAGMRGYNGLLSLMNASDDEYASLANTIKNSTGAAQKMADIRLDNLNGDLTIMKSAWDSIKIALGGQFQDEMRTVVQLFTDMLHAVKDFIDGNEYLIKGVLAGVAAIGAYVTVFNNYKRVVTAAKLVTEALSGGLLGLIGPAAIAGVTVGALVAGWKAYTSTDSYKVTQLTATLREQYDASKDLKDQFDGNTQTLKEFYKEHENVTNSYKEMLTNIGQTNARYEEQNRTTNSLIDKIGSLTDANGKLTGSEAELKAYVGELSEVMPSLGLTYDEETKSINKNASAVKSLANAKMELMRREIEEEEKKERVRRKIQLEEDERKTAEELAAAQRELDRARENATDSSEVLSLQTWKEEKAVAAAKKAHDEAVAALNENDAALNRLYDTMAEYKKEMDDANSGVNLSDSMTTDMKVLSDLAKKYEEAYEAAEKSIMGQRALWDEPDDTEAMSIDDWAANMQKQIEYTQQYRENLDLLRETAATMENSDAFLNMVNSFADGSKDSVNAVAGLAEAAKNDKGKLEELAESYSSLRVEQEETADAIGKFAGDLQSALEQMEADAETAMSALNMSEEAGNAARATLQAYVEQFESEEWSNRVRAGVAKFEGIYSGIINRGVANGAKTPGYASGTSSAPSGWKMVGEEGPELMLFNGGERVLNHGDTTRVLRDAATSSNNSVSVSFNIGGNADTNTVAQLQAYADDFAERVMDVINSANADSARRAYA